MLFEKPKLYFEVYQGSVKATELASGLVITKRCAGLNHPRTLIGDFFSVEACFTLIVKELCPKKWLTIAPILYIHLLEKGEGGYTNIEVKAVTEAGLGAGGRIVKLIASEVVLSKEKLLNEDFLELTGI